MQTSKFISMDLLKHFIDFEKSDENFKKIQKIDVQVSTVSINLEKGSHDSISFLREVL